MSLGPYTIFDKAADQLVHEFKMRKSGKIRPGEPISPVMVIFIAILENFGPIHSLITSQGPDLRLVLSHMEDKAGLIPHCLYRLITIRAPSALIQGQVSPGDRILINALMTIKPPGVRNCDEWPIEYHPGDGPYCLGFREVGFLEKL